MGIKSYSLLFGFYLFKDLILVTGRPCAREALHTWGETGTRWSPPLCASPPQTIIVTSNVQDSRPTQWPGLCCPNVSAVQADPWSSLLSAPAHRVTGTEIRSKPLEIVTAICQRIFRSVESDTNLKIEVLCCMSFKNFSRKSFLLSFTKNLTCKGLEMKRQNKVNKWKAHKQTLLSYDPQSNFLGILIKYRCWSASVGAPGLCSCPWSLGCT